MLPPKRFKQNTTKATEIKRNGTEAIGIDQDGVAKSIDIEVLMTKDNVGLGDVDNTSDADKPVSIAQGGALALKESVANVNTLKGTGWAGETVKGNAEDIATLNGDDSTEGSVLKSIKDAVSPIDTRLTGLDTLTYEGTTYMVSRKIENGHLVTVYTEVA